ncbi:hypothetical protein GQ54DRAFT_298605 [Martensiomyces pterosporus]|nr:hypothetical protein GQ54DRAFT_298605 [Martensiomyces pterosporus]
MFLTYVLTSFRFGLFGLAIAATFGGKFSPFAAGAVVVATAASASLKPLALDRGGELFAHVAESPAHIVVHLSLF